jgi:hypothetical protein
MTAEAPLRRPILPFGRAAGSVEPYAAPRLALVCADVGGVFARYCFLHSGGRSGLARIESARGELAGKLPSIYG